MFVLWCGATVISGLVRRRAMQGSQSIEDGWSRILEVAEHHRQEAHYIGMALESQVGSRLVGVEQIVLDNQEPMHRLAGHQMGQQLSGALHPAFWRSLPPSCAPSTLFGSP